MKKTIESLRWLVIFFVVSMVFAGAGQTAPQLDTGFGENGFIVKDFGNGDDEIFAIAPQDDGKILVAGYYDNGAVKNLVVARYQSTGELDTAFNNDGIFTHSMGAGDSIARSLAIQSDGMIVVAGSVNDGEHNIAVLRLTGDGFLDNTFADNGQLLLPVADGEVNAYSVDLTPAGAIFVAGTVVKTGDAGTYGIVVKLTAAGQSDENFGEAGVSLIQYDYDAEIRTLALQADGKIVIAGSFAPGGSAEAGLLRLNENGTLDETFGETGRSLLTLEGSSSLINDVSLDTAGSLFVTGEVNNGTYSQTFVASVTGDGTVDPAFADSGVYLNTSTSENAGQAIVLRQDGTLLVAGFDSTDNGKDVYLLTVAENADPSSQAKLSTTYVIADLAGADDVGNGLAVIADGSVFVAGSTGISGSKDLALLRFIGVETPNALNGGMLSTGAGVSTAGYTLVTKPVTGITRVGAFSGGIITDNGNSECADACADTCSNDTSANGTCYTACFSACELPTVTLRGVVYGVKENPVYDENSDQDSSTSTSTSTTDTDTSTSNGSSSTTSQITSSTSEDTIFPETGSWVYDIVRSGQTEDGSGTGSFDSEIVEITPNTLYHVRAYALLSDGTVIYGNEVTFKTDDACFIASAAFGSMLDRHVMILREFRDRVMVGTGIGQRLVGAYYSISPAMAALIEKHEMLRAVVRIILVPFVLFAYFILKTGAVAKVGLLAAAIGTMIIISRKTPNKQGISV